MQLRETVRARATPRETEREAEKVETRLLNQVDERRSPCTSATVKDPLDRWLDVVDRKTRAGYISKIDKHVRPCLTQEQAGRIRAEAIEVFCAGLRKCRDHCRGERFIQHPTSADHVGDVPTARRKCTKSTVSEPDRGVPMVRELPRMTFSLHPIQVWTLNCAA